MEAVGEQEAAKLYPRDCIPEQGRTSPGPPATAASSLDLQEPSCSSSTDPHPKSQPAADVHTASPDNGSTDQTTSRMASCLEETGLPQMDPASASTPAGAAQEPDGAALQVVSEQSEASESAATCQADAPESANPAEQRLHGKEELSQLQAVQPVQLRLAKQAVPSAERQKPDADNAGPNSKATALEHVTVELVAATKAPNTGQTSKGNRRSHHRTCQYMKDLQDAASCPSPCRRTHLFAVSA